MYVCMYVCTYVRMYVYVNIMYVCVLVDVTDCGYLPTLLKSIVKTILCLITIIAVLDLYFWFFFFLYSSVDYLFKFLVIGNAGVGKSCLLHQFIEHKCKFTQFVGKQLSSIIDLCCMFMSSSPRAPCSCPSPLLLPCLSPFYLWYLSCPSPYLTSSSPFTPPRP